MLRRPRQRRWDLCPPATQSVSAFVSEFSTLCRHSAVGVCMPRLPSISSSCWLSWLVSCEEHQAHARATLGVQSLVGDPTIKLLTDLNVQHTAVHVIPNVVPCHVVGGHQSQVPSSSHRSVFCSRCAVS